MQTNVFTVRHRSSRFVESRRNQWEMVGDKFNTRNVWYSIGTLFLCYGRMEDNNNKKINQNIFLSAFETIFNYKTATHRSFPYQFVFCEQAIH